MTAVRKGQPLPVSATAQVTTTGGVLQNVIVSASSSGTLSLYDSISTTNGTEVVTTFPLTAGSVLQFDMTFNFGIYAVVGGTATLTFTVT